MQHQILDQDYVEYSPISPIQYGTPFRIVVNGAAQQYWDLYNSYVVLRVKLVKATGVAFVANAGVAPINDIFDTFSHEKTYISVDVEKAEITIQSKSQEKKTGFTMLDFDRALIQTGGWVEYADRHY